MVFFLLGNSGTYSLINLMGNH